MIRTISIGLVGILVGVILCLVTNRYVATPLTVTEIRTLPARDLAVRLLGPYVGGHVIEAEQREYRGSAARPVPRDVTFYTQPARTNPPINGICGTDVITVEFDWFEHDDAGPFTPLKLNHIEAKSRFKAFRMPSHDPGSRESDALQAAECAKFTTALDSFAAPSAGDAQWLAAMEREYTQPQLGGRPFTFTCEDLAGAACESKARATLPHLALKDADLVEVVACPAMKSHDQANFCYRLTFPYKDQSYEREDWSPEWELTLVGGITDGFAPVEVRSGNLKHYRRPIVLY